MKTKFIQFLNYALPPLSLTTAQRKAAEREFAGAMLAAMIMFSVGLGMGAYIVNNKPEMPEYQPTTDRQRVAVQKIKAIESEITEKQRQIGELRKQLNPFLAGQ